MAKEDALKTANFPLIRRVGLPAIATYGSGKGLQGRRGASEVALFDLHSLAASAGGLPPSALTRTPLVASIEILDTNYGITSYL